MLATLLTQLSLRRQYRSWHTTDLMIRIETWSEHFCGENSRRAFRPLVHSRFYDLAPERVSQPATPSTGFSSSFQLPRNIRGAHVRQVESSGNLEFAAMDRPVSPIPTFPYSRSVRLSRLPSADLPRRRFGIYSKPSCVPVTKTTQIKPIAHISRL
jgi:hypothetical protein